MTAEIGILNKTSVVLAADSAATISIHKKVFNNANKLFPLSYFEPVGIMIYNNSNWMRIPLEIIIKSYSKNLHDKAFSTLLEYREDFIKYLKENFKKFINEEQIHQVIEYRLYDMLDALSDMCKTILADKIKVLPNQPTEEEKSNLLEKTFSEMIDIFSKVKTKVLPEFSEYKFEEFKLEFKKTIDKILPGFYSSVKIKRKSALTQKIYRIIFHELICKFSSDEDYSGIVIAGYGLDEIYPTICDVKIAEIISNKLRYESTQEKEISNKRSGMVCPFAQRDMIDTFFHGINPQIFTEIGNILKEEIREAIELIHKKHPQIPKADLVTPLNKAQTNSKNKILEYSKKHYINPIIQSIGYLRKEDLVEFAESLINITSIKRKTNSQLQSVGGPIDIAIITKHEGFVWVKRKDIIDKELNSAYFNREFKKTQ
jgi:hypothetical protein